MAAKKSRQNVMRADEKQKSERTIFIALNDDARAAARAQERAVAAASVLVARESLDLGLLKQNILITRLPNVEPKSIIAASCSLPFARSPPASTHPDRSVARRQAPQRQRKGFESRASSWSLATKMRVAIHTRF